MTQILPFAPFFPLQKPRNNVSHQDYYVVHLPEDDEVAIAFPMTGEGNAPPSATAAVSTTLPLCTLVGLKTPLNAPFELTANSDLSRK